jgi:elongation factor 2 kinase
MAKTTDNASQRKANAFSLLRDAAALLLAKEEPWAKYDLPSIPAERIIRHLYNPETRKWNTDETIVKIEKTPFTHGAMRFCYRMKKLAQPPKSATNHRFHKLGWARASNYLAKAYQIDGVIDTSDEAKKAVQNDIMLQYEAQFWASKFNDGNPPSKIHFIRAYAIEFPDREGQPWMAVERFIEGRDVYGAGFVKHNTNAGFVDTDLRRVTPQVFSAHSFYASEGQRLVADIQGVGDLCKYLP